MFEEMEKANFSTLKLSSHLAGGGGGGVGGTLTAM